MKNKFFYINTVSLFLFTIPGCNNLTTNKKSKKEIILMETLTKIDSVFNPDSDTEQMSIHNDDMENSCIVSNRKINNDFDKILEKFDHEYGQFIDDDKKKRKEVLHNYFLQINPIIEKNADLLSQYLKENYKRHNWLKIYNNRFKFSYMKMLVYFYAIPAVYGLIYILYVIFYKSSEVRNYNSLQDINEMICKPLNQYESFGLNKTNFNITNGCTTFYDCYDLKKNINNLNKDISLDRILNFLIYFLLPFCSIVFFISILFFCKNSILKLLRCLNFKFKLEN